MVVTVRDIEVRPRHPARAWATVFALELAGALPDYPRGKTVRIQVGPNERPDIGLLGSRIVLHGYPFPNHMQGKYRAGPEKDDLMSCLAAWRRG